MAAIKTSQAAKQRKARKPNIAASELTVLTEEVEDNIFILKSKFTDSVTNARKHKIWADITAAVNAVGVANRTTQEIRDKWKNLTSTAKREFTDFGKESRRTGGGPAPKPPSAATAKIIDMFKDTPSFSGLSGFESNPVADAAEAGTADLSPMPIYVTMSQQEFLVTDCDVQQPSTEMSPCIVNMEAQITPKNTSQNIKKRKHSSETVSQSHVLREQFKALKQKQENLELQNRKLQIEIYLLSKQLDPEEKENFFF